jgi:hypothetical protein
VLLKKREFPPTEGEVKVLSISGDLEEESLTPIKYVAICAFLALKPGSDICATPFSSWKMPFRIHVHFRKWKA